MKITVPYRRIDKQLAIFDSDIDAAEAHGLISALLCATPRQAREIWLAELVREEDMDNELVKETIKELGRVFDATEQALAEDTGEYELFLPDDEQPIRRRAAAVIHWCRGFLYGLGLSQAGERLKSAETREALGDMDAITQMDEATVEENNEESEEALMQLIEFLRVTVQLIKAELAEPATDAADE